jgi:hypothetical protein
MRALLTLLLVAAAPIAAAAARGDEAWARAGLLARVDAAVHAELAALESGLADDLEYCGVSATCSTKREYLETVRNATRRYK